MKKFTEALITVLKRRTVITALIFILVFCAVGFKQSLKEGLLGIALMILFICVLLLLYLSDKKRSGLHKENPLLSGMSLEYITQLEEPVVIVSEKGLITWYNKAFTSAISAKTSMYGKDISDCVSQSLNPLRLSNASMGLSPEIPIVCGETAYSVKSTKLQADGKQFFVTLWKDSSEKNRLLSEIENRKTFVVFIVIDNFAETMQFVQDKFRTASGLIASEIDAWCQKYNGIIKEYDKNRYFIIFEQQYYQNIIDSKFDILDNIRRITVEGVSNPFTASIGVAKIEGTLSEKESASRRALDMALQRGGDQAVVKTKDSTDYYGGKTKTVSKRTKIRARVVANELEGLIKGCKNVIIMGHKYADHDSVGSCIAISKIAQLCGKDVNIVVNIHDFNLKPIFAHMRGSTIYNRMLVDKSHAQDLITSDTLLIVCDVNNPAHFEAPELYETASRFVVIDHHRKTAEFENPPQISYIEPSASSACEMVCEMLEQLYAPGTLSQIEADLLFAGILLDTKQFTVNTGVRTFGAARYLREEGANPIAAQKLFRVSVEDLVRETKFENNVIIYKEKIAIAAHDEPCSGEDKIAAAKASDRLLNVAGVSASFVLCNIDGTIHISARSDGTINVQLILEVFGGGGHFDAAGAQVSDESMKAVLEKLKTAIDNYEKNR